MEASTIIIIFLTGGFIVNFFTIRCLQSERDFYKEEAGFMLAKTHGINPVKAQRHLDRKYREHRTQK